MVTQFWPSPPDAILPRQGRTAESAPGPQRGLIRAYSSALRCGPQQISALLNQHSRYLRYESNTKKVSAKEAYPLLSKDWNCNKRRRFATCHWSRYAPAAAAFTTGLALAAALRTAAHLFLVAAMMALRPAALSLR